MTPHFPQKDIPSLLERYELKYLIPEEMVEPISSFVSAYCDLDYYSEKQRDGYYPINSLYFDSPCFIFLRRRLHRLPSRYNLRIRSYGSSDGLPCFFEVKHKKNKQIRKYRARIEDKGWAERFTFPGYHEENAGQEKNAAMAQLFRHLALSNNASPKILTQYKRKAFISNVDDYARVTFDKALKYQARSAYNLLPGPEAMINYDDSTIFDPGAGIILELKCYTSSVPLWMLDLIRCFNLKQGRFSKYAAGMAAVFQSVRYDDGLRISGVKF